MEYYKWFKSCVAYIWLLFKYAFICIPNTGRHIRIWYSKSTISYTIWVNLYFIGSKRVEHGQKLKERLPAAFSFFFLQKKKHISDITWKSLTMKNFLKIVCFFLAQRACVAYIWLLFKYAFICIPNTILPFFKFLRRLITLTASNFEITVFVLLESKNGRHISKEEGCSQA
jgi:hypothetical protein